MNILQNLHNWASTWQQEIIFISLLILVFGAFQNLILLMQLALAYRELKHQQTQQELQNEESWQMLTSKTILPISIIIPAYNEELTIIDSVSTSLATEYPSFDVIVSNDGSTDKTLEVLEEKFQLKKSSYFFESELNHKPIKALYRSKIHPNLIVIDKANGGRSDALNAGISVSKTPLFCTLDADSILDPTSLLKSVQPFVEKPEEVMATGGTVRILNGCKIENGRVTEVILPHNTFALFQVIEYIRSFLIGRIAWSRLKALTIISGAFSIFRRDIAVKVGGFNTQTIGEDFELVMKIHRYCLYKNKRYDISFVAHPICWTEVPESWSVLSNQRIRWQQGALEVFFSNLKMFMNPQYGRIGTIAMPLMLIIDVLGPILEVAGYIIVPLFYILGVLNIKYMLSFLSLFFIFGVFISIMSLVLEENSLHRFKDARSFIKLAGVAIIENFGYRQINNVWRILGWWRFIIGKQSWGTMTRVGKKTETNQN